MTSGTALRAENCVKVCAERAWRLACALVWNTEDAHDVVQQACLVATAKADKIPADDPWPWFARVVTLESMKLREARARAARLVTALKGETVMAQHGNAVESREAHVRLNEALAQLPCEQRDALMLTHVGGLSMREAAASLGVSSSTVDRRVKQGLERLRHRLGEEKSALSSTLCCLHFDAPAQGMEQSLSSWLGMVHSPGVVGESIGGMTMLKYVAISCLMLVLLSAGGFFVHYYFAGGDFHEMMRALHGPNHQHPADHLHHP
jgi:RNA polymerase sigma factor (sigma-70 family)